MFLSNFSELFSLNKTEELISEGSGYNNFFLYEDAIKSLNKAIRLDPDAEEAYKERALSFFETNRIDLALNDYYQVVKNKPPYKSRLASQFIPILNCSTSIHSCSMGGQTGSLDFAKGVLQGSLLGCKEGTVDFISSVRGGLTFLWSFACSPLDVSKELIEALYEMGVLIAEGKFSYLVEAVLPEIIECNNYWDTWSEYTKGQKLGFIVGKYSILVFYEITSFKGGAYFYNKLKRANIMSILERYSITKSSCILEESARHAKKSRAILNKATAGTVIPHNPNVPYHILVKKHRWEKFISITGNYEIDFKNLTAFLEGQNILQCPRKIDFNYGGVITYRYTKEIGSDRIVAVFEITKDNVPLLRNAWIEVNVPYAH